MRSKDVVLDKENNSQPSPLLGWVRIVGQDKIDITNLHGKMQHIVEGYGKKVYANLPVCKGDRVHVEGNFLWGRFYEMTMEDNQ